MDITILIALAALVLIILLGVGLYLKSSKTEEVKGIPKHMLKYLV